MPHQKIREDNKKRVVEESARLFMEIGFEKTTIDMIADTVGITKRSVLNYYETKLDLIMAVYKYYEAAESEGAAKYVTSEEFTNLSGMEQINRLIRRALQHAVEQSERVCQMEKMQQYLLKETKGKYNEYQLGADILLKYVRDAIAKGKEDGSIREDAFCEKYDIDILLIALVGSIKQIAFYETLENDAIKDRLGELVEEIEKKVRRIFGAYLGD